MQHKLQHIWLCMYPTRSAIPKETSAYGKTKTKTKNDYKKSMI